MPPKRSAKSSKHQTEAQSKATVAKPKNVGKSKSEGSKVSSSRGQVKENPNVDKLEGSPAKKPRICHASHSTVGGSVLTVGEGDVGQLGLGPDVLEKSRVGHVELPSSCIQIAAGGMHTACLMSGGEVYTFGCNDEGALGRDTSEDDSETTPAKLSCTMEFVQISAGDSHTAMLTSDGQIYACGTFRDANGSIGLTESGPQKSPVHIQCAKPVKKIASGCDHLLALAIDGTVFSAGCADQGQLGRVAECFTSRGGRKGLALLLNLQPVHFRGTKTNRRPKFDDIWAATYASFARSTNGDIYTWGLNNYYQLGTGDMENRFVPEVIPSTDSKWSCVAGGQHHSVVLNDQGKVFCMGRGTYGQLGLGETATADAEEPTKVPIPESCVSVEASSSVTFAVTKTGKAYGWGMGTSKQLSSGNEDDQFEPQLMGGKQLNNKQVLSVSSGGQHTVMLVKAAEELKDAPPST